MNDPLPRTLAPDEVLDLYLAESPDRPRPQIDRLVALLVERGSLTRGEIQRELGLETYRGARDLGERAIASGWVTCQERSGGAGRRSELHFSLVTERPRRRAA